MFSNRPLTYDLERKFQGMYSGQRNHHQEEEFPSNFIKTSRYNVLTFFPKSLLLQFTRYANIYFLCIAIIQCIPALSTLNPFSAIAPLVFVLGLSMLREGYEDYGRHVSDNEVNATKCIIFNDKKQEEKTWADICVGDYILVKQNDAFPADLIVLGSSIESGACYIETSSLDGEKNLKPKSAILETQGIFKHLDFQQVLINVEAKPPTQSLYELDASIFVPQEGRDGGGLKKFQLNQKQLLLRGAYLRNTEWVIGVTVYTGQDTKIMRNADASRVKSSEIETTMNILILGILIVQLILSTITASFQSAWLHSYALDSWYLGYAQDYNPDLLSFYVFFSYMLLYNTMIPISLIVSLEFVKVFQAYFMEKDEEMYVKQRDKYCKVQTTTINEELGQVEYIFSDKTGTLTCNQMEFKYCIIGTTLYGKSDEITRQGTMGLKKQKSQIGSQVKIYPVPSEESEVFQHSVFKFHDQELSAILADGGTTGNTPVNLEIKSQDSKKTVFIQNQKQLIENFFFLLASAHECIVQYDSKQNANYQGPSPDEITLVDAAARLGFKFQGASASEQKFNILSKMKLVKLLKSFEFDSNRKRMSVIIKDEQGIIRLLIKGADNIIKSRLAPNQQFLDRITEYLEEFSKIGLRCLMMGTRILSEEEYQKFDEAYNNLPDTEDRASKLEQLTDNLERNLTLLGATAVEDKLQTLVPETIYDLIRANIKVWMLTGDKLETAENIAKSCKLIQGDFTVMRLSVNNVQECKLKLRDNRDTFDLCIKENRKKSFLVEGESLKFVIENEDLAQIFVDMAKDCESVVCCRVTPKQKADVVKLIKDRLNKITLAIGDGANDVNMIQAAHIGVGLYGNEGMRAVQSSDFALGEFRCLWRLLLVHGHWNYIRIAEMVLYFFYKNMIFTVPQFFYSYFCAFSGQSFFDDWYITFYNLIFTALPLIIRGTFDQDLNYRQHIEFSSDERIKSLQMKQEDHIKQKFPSLYYVGQEKTIFTIPNYVIWAFTGLVHGMIAYFFILWMQDFELVEDDGYPSGMAALSLTVYSVIVFIADLSISIQTKYWTWFNFISLTLCSVVIYFIYVVISNYWPGTLMEFTPLTMLKMPNFWLCCTLVLGIVLALESLQAELVRQFFNDPAVDMLVRVKQFTKNAQQFIENKVKIQPYDSFWEQIYKEENNELIQFDNSSNNNAQQGQVI